MIAATYNCGCPVAESISIGPRSPCGPCCSSGASQRKRPRSVRPPRCSDRRAVESASRMGRGSSHGSARAARTSDSKFRRLEGSDAKRAPSSDRVVSEIARRGQPYKEIEAIINDSRVVVRTHKEPIKEEYDPPCECVGQEGARPANGSTSSLKRRCDDGVTFEMAEGSLELCRAPREKDASSATRIGDRPETGGACRTITLYPQAEARRSDEADEAPTVYRATRERGEKLKSKEGSGKTAKRPIDLEENPNIFLLRIRKRCYSGDKRHKIELEFRAPRPWRPRWDEKKEKHPSEDMAEKLGGKSKEG